MKNKVKKAASKALREMADEAIIELQIYSVGIFKLVI